MNLDVFRFIAAFMIVIVHGFEGWHGWFGYPRFMTTGGDFQTLNKPGEYLFRGIMNLGFGVDIFFLMSGFLITYLLVKERDETGKISLPKFYMRRILRIWPLYYFIMVLSPFLLKWLGETIQPNYLMTGFFLNNFDTMHTEKWVYPFAHFWSICIEEHFYLFWPLLVSITPKKRLIELFCLIIFISIVFRSYVALTNPQPWMTLYLHTLSRCDVLALGSLFGYLHYQKPIKIGVPFSVRLMLYTLFLCTFFIDTLVYWDNFFLAVFKKYFYVGIVGFGMYNYMFNPEAKWQIKKKGVLHYMGKVSYGTYMYHNVVILIIIKKLMLDHHIGNMYVYAFAILVACIIIPIISYELIEKPFLKLKGKFEVVQTRR